MQKYSKMLWYHKSLKFWKKQKDNKNWQKSLKVGINNFKFNCVDVHLELLITVLYQ